MPIDVFVGNLPSDLNGLEDEVRVAPDEVEQAVRDALSTLQQGAMESLAASLQAAERTLREKGASSAAIKGLQAIDAEDVELKEEVKIEGAEEEEDKETDGKCASVPLERRMGGREVAPPIPFYFRVENPEFRVSVLERFSG